MIGFAAIKWLKDHEVPSILAVLPVIAGAFSIAVLITYLVERPAMRAIRALWKRHVSD